MRFQGLLRILGITLLLLAVCAVTMAINPSFAKTNNLENILHWTALFGILALGAAFVIITGGIDLSIGSVVAITGIILALLLTVTYAPTGETVTLTEVDEQESRLVVAGLPPGFTLRDQIEFEDRTSAQSGARRSVRIDAERTKLAEGGGVIYAQGNVRWLKSLGPEDLGAVKKAQSWNAWLAVPFVLLVAAGIGLIHGLLITKVNMQPFIVTLCGLLIYRGLSRYLAGDDIKDLTDAPAGLKALDSADPFSVPSSFTSAQRSLKDVTESDGREASTSASGPAHISGKD